MKLAETREIGIACGLVYDYEHVNNIILYDIYLFRYDDIDRELDELILDAKTNGVHFAKCGAADITAGNKLCYMCKKLSEV